MRVDVLFPGFPGRMTRGYMGWSSVIYLEVRGTKVLFDTGGAVERGELPARLKERGLTTDDIDYVVLSHFHCDHALNADCFRRAKILLHAAEYDWVKSDPDDWPTPKFLLPALESGGRLEVIAGEPEILPHVQVLHTPGHTPGCLSLLLTGDDLPATVLAGDAVKNLAELAAGEAVMSHDNAASQRSIRRIREVAAVVIPGHDRTLRVMADRIMAVTACRETITVPAGVAGAGGPRRLELVIEPTWLPRK